MPAPAPTPAPVPAPAPATGSALDCYSFALTTTAGTTVRVVYDYSGVITGQQTVASTVGGITSFEGFSARETTTTTTGSNTIGGATVAIDTELKSYQTALANGETTQYGVQLRAVTPAGGFALTTNSKTVFSPPWVDRRFTLTAGQSIVQTFAGTTTSTSTGIPGLPATPTTTNTSSSQTVRFVGIESVTVPLGTYQACKFEEFATATPSEVTTNWLALGNGVLLRSTATTTQGTQVIAARTLLINGAAP